MAVTLNIHRKSDHWRICHDVEAVVKVAVEAAWQKIEKYPKHKQPVEMGLVLADDAFVQSLNKTYRNKDQPTNVLSFPNEEEMMLEEDNELGDVIFAFETIEREAKEAHISLEDHLSHMVIHGVLHLLGYDHIASEEAEEMENLETLILAQLGVDDPYH